MVGNSDNANKNTNIINELYIIDYIGVFYIYLILLIFYNDSRFILEQGAQVGDTGLGLLLALLGRHLPFAILPDQIVLG